MTAHPTPDQNYCVHGGGSLCCRHRLLLRKLLVNKVWSEVACRFQAWKTFCIRSRVLLHRLLVVDQRQRRQCAFSRWKKMVYSQQLSEQAEAVVVVRRSHQAAKQLARVLTKHDTLLVLSVWVEWRSWHRKQRCALFQRVAICQYRRRFRQWFEFASQSKARRGQRVQQVREMLNEVVDFSVTSAEFARARNATSDGGNGTQSTIAKALTRCFDVVHRIHQRQELGRTWSRWYKVGMEKSQCTASPTLSDSAGRRPKNPSGQLSHPQRIARRSDARL